MRSSALRERGGPNCDRALGESSAATHPNASAPIRSARAATSRRVHGRLLPGGDRDRDRAARGAAAARREERLRVHLRREAGELVGYCAWGAVPLTKRQLRPLLDRRGARGPGARNRADGSCTSRSSQSRSAAAAGSTSRPRRARLMSARAVSTARRATGWRRGCATSTRTAITRSSSVRRSRPARAAGAARIPRADAHTALENRANFWILKIILYLDSGPEQPIVAQLGASWFEVAAGEKAPAAAVNGRRSGHE